MSLRSKLYSPLYAVRSMSDRVRYAMGAVGCAAAGTMGFLAFGGKGLVIVLVGLVVVALLVFTYILVLRMARKRKAARFSQQMEGQSVSTPHGVSRAEQLAKLDDLRKMFQNGVDKFKAAGKNLYDLPWFLVVGEPGSGKTEAIRHSNIGFPAGLQDELQGVGGTINMNWWFTNHAVLLDVAGRLMFDDVATGTSSEWQEFLRLMRANRPNCPVNGMLLVIPAESLIKDSAEEIQRKGAKIAEQLDVIQRTLDIRFPIVVTITKCDLINGFREFFDGVSSPQLQHQMVGWSNPLPIDEPFQPEQVEEHMQGLQKHIDEMRLLLLQDPAPSQDLSDRRMDEVDALYDFPASFGRMVPALREYLQLIFTSSDWSSKPLFLRGIYLTSSMREGAALDAELADALGVPPEALPEGRVWERDRSYFLRDVFVSKLFAEQGLVTRATNVRQQHVRRKMVVMGAAALSALLLLGLTGLGYVKLNRSVGGERDLWAFAADKIAVEEGHIRSKMPLVAPDAESSTGYVYGGAVPVKVAGKTTTIGRFNEDLQDRVEKPLRVPRIFRLSRPFDRSLLQERKSARRALFELSVLGPLVQASRDKMEMLPDAEWPVGATEALTELVRIEAAYLGEDYTEEEQLETPMELRSLFAFVLGPTEEFQRYEVLEREHLDRAFAWSYAREGANADWPPEWLPDGGRLEDSSSLSKGVEGFVGHCASSPQVLSLKEQFRLIEELGPRIRDFNDGIGKEYDGAEADYLRVFAFNLDKLKEFSGFLDPELQEDWLAEYEELTGVMDDLLDEHEGIAADLAKLTILEDRAAPASFSGAVSNSLNEVQVCFASLPLPGPDRGLLAMAKDMAKENVKEAFDIDEEKTLMDDIRGRMTGALTELEEQFLRPDLADTLAEFNKLQGGMSERIAASIGRFEIYAPLEVPEELRLRKLSWSEFPNWLRELEVSFVQEDLEEWCKEVDEVFSKCEALGVEAPKDSVSLIRKNANLGLGRVKSRNFKRECEKILDNWSQVSGEAIRDRELLLGMTPRSFQRKYLLRVPESEDDYVAQYWEELILTALESLTDESLLRTEALLPRVEKYARFPLDVPPAGGVVEELSWDELQDAGQLLKQIGVQEVVEEAKSLGEGAEVGAFKIDAQLEQLRNLDLGEKAQWVNAAKALMAALPTEEGRRSLCKVWLPPGAEQERLMDAFGKGNFKDDSVVPVWTVMRLYEGPGSQTRKEKTYQANAIQVGRLTYPGEGFDIKLFKYHSDKDPNQNVPYPSVWACLRILHDTGAVAVDGEPTKWYVPVAVRDEANHERILWLQFEFEQPLPALEDWPRLNG